ncbi:MAG: sigma-70 family RNA polymerase sigma factor [Myxococcales bacterium FL481]|nr:MAG: sigma-70 family RNA polymerase sigma factor [Myxococcales bacterium FL481]
MSIDVEDAYRRYGPMVLRRCRKLLSDEQLARDVMHDVFVQLLRHRNRLDDRGMSSLLYRIATNLSLNRIRSRKRRPEQPADDLLTRIAAVDESELATQARNLLAAAFAREPVSTRTIAVLHLVDGMTLEETAQAVGLSVSGVRKRLRKLRASVQELEASCA